MSSKRRRVYRGWTWFWYFDLEAKEWVNLTQQQITGPGGVVLVSPDESQIFAMQTGSGAMCRFVDADTGVITLAGRSPVADTTSQDYTIAYDSLRNRYILIGSKDTLRSYILTINWETHTCLFTKLTNSTHNGLMSGGMALIYDRDQDCFWACGGKDEANKLGKFARIIQLDGSTLTATPYQLSTEIICQCKGQYGRWIFLDKYRAIGLLPNAETSAIVIKLPGISSVP